MSDYDMIFELQKRLAQVVAALRDGATAEEALRVNDDLTTEPEAGKVPVDATK